MIPEKQNMNIIEIELALNTMSNFQILAIDITTLACSHRPGKKKTL
jgi:hypothetical protein